MLLSIKPFSTFFTLCRIFSGADSALSKDMKGWTACIGSNQCSYRGFRGIPSLPFGSTRIFAYSWDLFPLRNYSLGFEVICSQPGIVNLQHNPGVIDGGIKDLQTMRAHYWSWNNCYQLPCSADKSEESISSVATANRGVGKDQWSAANTSHTSARIVFWTYPCVWCMKWL